MISQLINHVVCPLHVIGGVEFRHSAVISSCHAKFFFFFTRSDGSTREVIFIAISQTYHVVCPLLGLGIEAVLMLRIMPAQCPKTLFMLSIVC